MKRALLFLFLVVLVYPVFSQNIPSNKEKRHTTKSAQFRKTAEIPVKQEKFDFLFNFGSILIKNNAQADSMMMNIYDNKGSSWMPYLKEYPEYYSQSNLIDELEVWFYEGNGYERSLKYRASYDENKHLTRLETHVYQDGAWVPDFAEESILGIHGEETFYAYYIYNAGIDDWEMIFGYRANDKHNENDVLVERIWEYYEYNEWLPEYLEEYVLNDQDVIIEIIEYMYDDWDETWEKEFRMVMELCENNMWQQGYAYFWDWIEERWVPELKYHSFEWFDFDLLLYTHLVAMANPDGFDDWDDWKSHDDIDWINYMRITMEYNEAKKMTLMLQEIWYDFDWKEDWIPFLKMETEYDHLSNVVYEAMSIHDGVDWQVFFGFLQEMEYNSEGAIKSFTTYLIASDWDDDDWKIEQMPLFQYTYYYSDDTTDTPIVRLPLSELKAYPNPATNYIHLDINDFDHLASISIIGVDGKVYDSFNQVRFSSGKTVTLDVSGLKSGVYMIVVKGPAMNYVTRFVRK